ncbi:Crp/Fnr family transcriptional regulator [Aquimarina sp. 2201CG5-10]|uniref:Crp/Fnr family transcriptional regulator n=1 Tax=Aquimarina callyspongiae TaxID=3098150 RepID=UPI002AB5431A|nr:helix-turn-helix domain-containing protein [Aquimarina sp. 2201CG5-10]MDY8135490.1 helix-turn-helix domain-containing protein [Aquimarina sp. 2201CG5-10]
MLDLFFKQLHIHEEELKKEIKQQSYITEHAKGDLLIKTNEYIQVLKIVLKGKVRVFQESEDREVLIYYLGDMETCTLSLSACFDDCKSNVKAIVEEPSIVLNIPVRFVKDWCFKYKSWNNFNINTFRESYQVLMESYARLAFKPLRERLLEYLLEESQNLNQKILQRSHQQIANELGTTREVVSRLLKKLEKEELIRLGQKSVEILK